MKKGTEFEGGKEWVYPRIWMEEREERNATIQVGKSAGNLDVWSGVLFGRS